MADLARPIPRPQAKTKVLVLRPAGASAQSAGGVRSVRKADEPAGLSLKLALGVIVALGSIILIWLLGYVGYKLGFAASIVGVSDLQGRFDEGLITGVMMLIAIPRLVIMAGVAQPMWLMIGFAMIAIPGGCHAGVHPATPGGPKPPVLTVVFSFAASIAAILASMLLLTWAASPIRTTLLTQLPARPAEAELWLLNLQTLAGLDVLAAITASLWTVLAMRVAAPLWLKSIAASAAFFTLVVVAVAMAISIASATHVEAPRSLVYLDDGALEPRLILGSTPTHLATLVYEHPAAHVELLAPPATMHVVGSQSIVELLIDHATAE